MRPPFPASPAFEAMCQDIVCYACKRPRGDVPLLLCAGCTVTRYCSASCQRANWPQHKERCRMLAGYKLMKTIFTHAGELNPHTWLENEVEAVEKGRSLTSSITQEEVDDLLALSDKGFHEDLKVDAIKIRPKIIALAGALQLFKRSSVTQRKREMLVSKATGCLEDVPSFNGRFDDNMVLRVLIFCGDTLADLDRPSEAVALARKYRARVESANGHQNPKHRSKLYAFYSRYEQWLVKATPTELGCKVLLLEPMHAERGEMLRRCLIIAKSEPMLQEKVQGLLGELATFEGISGAFTKALAYAQEALRLPPGPQYGVAAHMAAEMLCKLKRTAQAEAVVDEALIKAREAGVLCDETHSVLLCVKAQILCGKRRYTEALDLLNIIEGFSEQPEAARMNMVLQKATVYEAMGHEEKLREVEEILGPCAYARPAAVVRCAEELAREGYRMDAIDRLREASKDYDEGGYMWLTQHAASELDDLRPLELLRTLLLEEGGTCAAEARRVGQKIKELRAEEDKLRAEALQEAREMTAEARQQQGPQQGGKGRRKKKEKKQRKKGKKPATDASTPSSHAQGAAAGGGGGGSGVGLQATSLDAGTTKEANVAAPEPPDADECAICLGELDDGDGEVVEALGCSTAHRFHSTCLDCWACKCAEKGLAVTCPTCRKPMQRAN